MERSDFSGHQFGVQKPQQKPVSPRKASQFKTMCGHECSQGVEHARGAGKPWKPSGMENLCRVPAVTIKTCYFAKFCRQTAPVFCSHPWCLLQAAPDCRRVPVPSYASTFRTFPCNVLPSITMRGTASDRFGSSVTMRGAASARLRSRALHYNARRRHPICALQSFDWVDVKNFKNTKTNRKPRNATLTLWSRRFFKLGAPHLRQGIPSVLCAQHS